MQHISKAQAVKFANSSTCTGLEYAFGDKDINGALGVVTGRYPESGWVVNEVCKELVYVISGAGSLHNRTEDQVLAPGDCALIPSGEEYYFEGQELTVLMPCSPAWYPEQHKEIAD
ncbi:MAG TPA: cupin domain-containing protein [Candidatus Saccharimonadales bacterium]|nr:cupin domain-containing protein [Candidatus Saccharimonadales bacterium]